MRALLGVTAVVPLGFACKFYRGPGAHWMNDSFAGTWYVVFWCLAAITVNPRWQPWRVAAAVLTATCILEFLQLWHPPFLEWLRSFFLGRAILGSSFDWGDFPYYFLGAAIAWAVTVLVVLDRNRST